MEEKHITALADVDHQYSTTMAKCEAAKESAEVRLQLAEERFQQEMGKKDSMHQFALDNMKSDTCHKDMQTAGRTGFDWPNI
eukprot:g31007.t2